MVLELEPPFQSDEGANMKNSETLERFFQIFHQDIDAGIFGGNGDIQYIKPFFSQPEITELIVSLRELLDQNDDIALAEIWKRSDAQWGFDHGYQLRAFLRKILEKLSI